MTTLTRRQKLLRDIKLHIPFYLMLILPVALVVIFHYAPIYGIQIAFKDFKMKRGITDSEWIGLKHFRKMFKDQSFYRVLGNTVRLSLLNLLFSFPITVIFALMMNEIRSMHFKKVTQTITYLPHFLSWVVVGSFVYQILSPTHGAVNALLVRWGILDQPVYFMIKENYFTPVYLIASIWKELGWGIVIYLSTLSGIDPALYEAAEIDGASRWQRMLNITLPGLLPIMSTLFILNLGSILNVGFDPIFNLYNEGTYRVADVISTYVYRRGMLDAKYDYTTAIGLFQNVVGFIFVLISNRVIKRMNPDFEVL